eukprot:s916_g14.t1
MFAAQTDRKDLSEAGKDRKTMHNWHFSPNLSGCFFQMTRLTSRLKPATLWLQCAHAPFKCPRRSLASACSTC